MSNQAAHENYLKTIEKPVSISIIQAFVSQEICNRILTQYPDGNVYVWGIVNGKNHVNRRKWERIERGDITLFVGKDGIFASAVTTLTLRNEMLARELWGEDKNGNTWENIYLVEDIKNVNIPYLTLNRLLGYKENNVIRGFSVLNDEKSERLNQKFDLFNEEICEEVSEKDYMFYVAKLEEGGEFDIEKMAFRRKEQSFLRSYLFGGKSSCVCGICGRKLPVNMLFTSHIKQRSECSKQEKMDYKNIVMPMCKFGCDDLYEKGYIYVWKGKIKINPRKWITEDLKRELDKLDGRTCEYYNEDTKPYFEAHRRKFGIEWSEQNDEGNNR